jgi:outer membrane protein assembly factor BamB
MKVQCSCGAKYAFDVTPEMAQNPVQLICQGCGADLSPFVNELIRQELQPAAPPAAPPANPLRKPIETNRPRMRIQGAPTEPAAAPAETPADEEWPMCLKHPHQRTTHRCVMCNKPICPDCMALFGYVCSPLCRAKATANGIRVPVFKGERAYIEGRRSRLAGLAGMGVAVVITGLIGFWGWYAFFGSQPHRYFSVPFAERAISGESAVCADNQIVFLHGATLARYDMKQNREIWSRDLLAQSADFRAARFLHLRVDGQNVWVASPEKLTRYDWDDGEPKQDISLTGGDVLLQSNEVEVVDTTPGNCSVTHISLADGTTRTEEVKEPAASSEHRAALAAASSARTGQFGGQSQDGQGAGSPAAVDPSQIADKVQHMSYPARIALPATLANAWEQERLEQEMKEDSGAPNPAPAATPAPTDDFALIPQQDGCLQFSVRLVEQRLVTVEAMKDRSATSALNGHTSVSDTTAVANEILNDMQRDKGGDKVTEDQSIYQVTLRRADDQVSNAWTGMVAGPPGLVSLKTVNVLTAGESLQVFDKANNLLWQAKLTFSVPLANYANETAENSFGAGPFVEHDGTLFVADAGVLTAFDLHTGEARWRLPTIGITGMFLDDAGMIYVNSTTANLDKLRYSRQIDIAQKIDPVVMKIDPDSGKTLWSVKPGGFISYVSGPFVYVMISYAGDFNENGDSKYGTETGLEKSAYMKIKRLDPKTGAEMWEYDDDRCPLDAKYNRNVIQLVFHKEVQALKFLVF